MKICEFHIHGNTIEFKNTFWGVEKIYYNGRLMAKRYSTLGTVHFFEVQENEEWVEYEVETYADWSGNIACKVYRNGKYMDEHWGRMWGTCRRSKEDDLQLV